MKTYSAKPSEVEKKWLLIDADGVILGRLASVIAMRLRGKHKAMFTPHIDCGDNVIVINADKVKVTGRKLKNDYFYWHTGFPGGLKKRSKGQILDGAHPERVLENAVRRMMPKDSPLARGQMTNLRLFAGPNHDHAAQNPEVLDVAAMNPKNKRS
jgi:large subunit ribosomal protein L13